MYRDNSLMPKEAVRLAVLGTLMQGGRTHYADLASAVRAFTGRVMGPSLDLMGTSLEVLRHEGLISAVDGQGVEDNALLEISDAGRDAFSALMQAGIRAPSADDLNKLVITLKLRFLHLLEPRAQAEQVDAIISLCETELARLRDLARLHAGEPGLLAAWLEHDMDQMAGRLAWLQRLLGHLAA